MPVKSTTWTLSLHNPWEWSDCSVPSWITGNSGPFNFHSLNLAHNVFTQFTSAFKSTKALVNFQLSPFFICTSSMIQSPCCNALGTAVAAMIAVLKGFLKLIVFLPWFIHRVYARQRWVPAVFWNMSLLMALITYNVIHVQIFVFLPIMF